MLGYASPTGRLPIQEKLALGIYKNIVLGVVFQGGLCNQTEILKVKKKGMDI